MTYSHTWEPEGVYLKFWEDTSGQEIDVAIAYSTANWTPIPRETGQ
jgi:hypothetical protein